MKIRLCYRIEKEAGWGKDENGDNCEVYSCTKIDTNSYNVDKKQYQDLVDGMRKLNAYTMNISEELITPITLNEYLDNTEEEE